VAENPTTTQDELEDESIRDDEELVEIGESTLNYFGADFDVAGLVRRLQDGDIIIPRFDPDESEGASLEGFQRQRVWPRPKMEKFIESLLLGWPVPSIFLVLEPDQRYLVLDGQQRLTALQDFYAGTHKDGPPFILHEVADHLKGATYDSLSNESRRRINNTFIQATVIEPIGNEGRESVYRLFGRLNSGGVTLAPQEIRVALYRGPIIDFVRDLNKDVSWRELFGNSGKRLKDHEMVLRSLAMEQVIGRINGRWGDADAIREAYSPPMSELLNKYLEHHRNLEGLDIQSLTSSFAEVCGILVDTVGPEGVRIAGRLNAAHIDALLSTLMHASLQKSMPTARKIKAGVKKLSTDKVYVGFVATGTSHRENVIGRLKLAHEAFRGR
jgi:hypothetical protein